MADEEVFDCAITNSKGFNHIHCRFFIIHPTLPGQFIEVDNLAQKKQTAFVFEGKSKKELAAISQLLVLQQSLRLFHQDYLRTNLLTKYE